MSGLADDGLILAAGPLAGTESGRIRVLLIADGDHEAEIVQRLAADPWELAGRITTTGIEPWTCSSACSHRLPSNTEGTKRRVTQPRPYIAIRRLGAPPN